MTDLIMYISNCEKQCVTILHKLLTFKLLQLLIYHKLITKLIRYVIVFKLVGF